MNSSVAVQWQAVCKLDDVLPGTGVGVRLPGGQAALFRTRDGSLYALDNLDPFSHHSDEALWKALEEVRRWCFAVLDKIVHMAHLMLRPTFFH